MVSSPIQRILVATDFSACSADALRFARGLAGALGASIEVLHVIDPSARVLGGSAAQASAAAADPDAARQLLHDFITASAGARANSLTERVESGPVHERIVTIAEQEGFDLVVMGTHGRTGRPQVLVGSVAETVVRTSARPVLTVREAAGTRTAG